jgi:ubiquinone/menaquinone biosynthesis C-methylase UbiE
MHFHWLTPWYDPLVELTLPDRKLKIRLLQQARISPGETILDVGCGTATLALMVKQMHPETTVIGLDVDLKILEIARQKALDTGVEINLHAGEAFRLPYPNHCIDRLLSSFLFHHLATENKRRALAEAFRVLRPGGELHVLDFGKPHNIYSLLVSYALRWTEEMADNVQGRLPEMFRDAGFVLEKEPTRFTTLFGTVSLYKAQKPVKRPG